MALSQDPSPLAAARRAATLARATGARIVLLQVVSPDVPPIDWNSLQRELTPLLEGITVVPQQRRGPAAREILAAAYAENAGLIVMTRHGRWQSASELGFPRFLLHSVVCRVLLDADCPVWIEPEAGAPPVTRVMCAVASLVHDRDTIERTGALAATLGAKLTLFRNSVSAAISVPGQQERTQAWQQEVAMAVQADMEAVRETMGVIADVRVGIGGFVPALLREAEAEAAGLIAVRRTSRDWGTDEVLQPLVRGAHVPMLVWPGARRRVSAPAPIRPSRFSQTASLALLLAVMLVGVLLVHHIFARARQVDCETQAYRCAVRENLMNSTQDRIGQPQPKADPRLGPFKDDPPPKDAPRPPP